MTYLNLFFCGTLSHREQAIPNAWIRGSGDDAYHYKINPFHDGELVSWLGANVKGDDRLTVDGVGTGNRQIEQIRKFLPKAIEQSDFKGMALGVGWDQNVAFALAVILEQYLNVDRTKPPKKQLLAINMVGWSRGAVTCFMMANKLFDSQIMIPVRIFALDPVPGMTNFQDSRTTLPATVCDITVVYARDEQSMGFDALVPKLVGSTRARYHILPGKHATVAGNANADGDNGPYSPNLGAPGKIARHLAVSWLRDNNAAISSGSLGDFELLKLYNEILRDDKTYRAMKRFQPDSKILHSFDTDKKGNEARSYHDTPGKTYGSPFSTTADRISGLQGETEINEQGDFVNSHHRELWARSSAIKRHSIGVRYTARGAPDDRLRTEIGRSIEAFGSSIISKIRF